MIIRQDRTGPWFRIADISQFRRLLEFPDCRQCTDRLPSRSSRCFELVAYNLLVVFKTRMSYGCMEIGGVEIDPVASAFKSLTPA